MSGARIDLEQLATRESEQVEWKENVADLDSVVKTLAAFANDLANLGGGYVVCGAAERRDLHGFPSMVRTGLTAARMAEVKGKVLTRCRDRVFPSISPLIDELPSATDDRRILVFTQPSTRQAHTFRLGEDGAKHFVRVGQETIEARNGVLRELLVRKGAIEPWDRRPCAQATINDLDLIALRDTLQRMRVFSTSLGLEPYLSHENTLHALVPPLCVREPLTNELRPRNFTMLLFGRDPQRFIPGAFSLFSIYQGNDRSGPHAERHELAATLVEQARRLAELLEAQAVTTFDKNDPSAPNAVKYPRRALYEAMGNALAHRDYEMNDPTRVTVFEDRIEILSPGPLPIGIDPVAFREGKAHPLWRNQVLAWFFNRLQIAQGEGQGISTIIRSMREEGCPAPTLEASDVNVICVLPAHPRHGLLRDLREIELAISLGQMERAQRLIAALLERDRLNNRAWQLFAEVQTALADPAPVAARLDAAGPAIETLPPSVLLQLSEALGSDRHQARHYGPLASRLLAAASRGRLEERELRRIAVGMRRNRDEQAVLDLLDRQLKEHPEWKTNPSLLQLRGDSLIGLAKHCAQAAKRQGLSAAARQRGWRQFDDYLREAESELSLAQTLTTDSGLSVVIRRNMEFIEKLRRDNRTAKR